MAEQTSWRWPYFRRIINDVTVKCHGCDKRFVLAINNNAAMSHLIDQHNDIHEKVLSSGENGESHFTKQENEIKCKHCNHISTVNLAVSLRMKHHLLNKHGIYRTTNNFFQLQFSDFYEIKDGKQYCKKCNHIFYDSNPIISMRHLMNDHKIDIPANISKPKEFDDIPAII